MYPQQPGGQPPYQQGYQQPPDQGGGKSPWPWVFGAVALIVAGVIAALVITGSDDNSKKEPTTINRTVHLNVDDGAVTVTATGSDPGADGLSVVRATARAVWSTGADPRAVRVRAGDNTARAALQRWSLLTDADQLA